MLAECLLDVRLLNRFDCNGNIGELVSCLEDPAEAALVNALAPNILAHRIKLEALPREDRPVPVVQSYVAVEVNAKLLRR